MRDRLRKRLTNVNNEIRRLEMQQDDGSEFGDSPAIAGASGQSQRRIDARGRARDQMIDRASRLVELYAERDSLLHRIENLRLRPVQMAAIEEHGRRTEAAIRAAGVGVRVVTRYGEATVMRINRKTATIRTASGYREAMLFAEIGEVLGHAE